MFGRCRYYCRRLEVGVHLRVRFGSFVALLFGIRITSSHHRFPDPLRRSCLCSCSFNCFFDPVATLSLSPDPSRSYSLSEMPPIRGKPSPVESPGIMPQGIKRSRQACDPCRRKKSRCTGEKPVCATCRRLKQECSYKESFMSSFPDRYKDMENQVIVCPSLDGVDLG